VPRRHRAWPRKPGSLYRDLAEVVDVLHRLDISRRVVTLTPIGNIKG
jgi:RNA-splicing ligase RtcB